VRQHMPSASRASQRPHACHGRHHPFRAYRSRYTPPACRSAR
jgi:hypothetical protein